MVTARIKKKPSVRESSFCRSTKRAPNAVVPYVKIVTIKVGRTGLKKLKTSKKSSLTIFQTRFDRL